MNITAENLREVRQLIDGVFPANGRATGYATEHPELVAAILIADAIREIDNTLASTAKAALGIH